jgi:hypothetical protein
MQDSKQMAPTAKEAGSGGWATHFPFRQVPGPSRKNRKQPMKTKAILIVCLPGLCGFTALRAQGQEAIRPAPAIKPAQATAVPAGDVIRTLARLAEAGDPKAKVSLALAVRAGIDGPADPLRAVALFEEAAAAGDADAMAYLADECESGILVPYDPQKAKALREQAANAGSQLARWDLAAIAGQNAGGGGGVQDGPASPDNAGTPQIRRLSDPVSLGSLPGWLMLQPWFKSLEKSMPAGVRLSIVEHDREDLKWRILQIREIHAPGSGYDPDVSPTVGIFRVSADRKTTHWLDPVSDDWKPLADFLRRRGIVDGKPPPDAATAPPGAAGAYTPEKGSPERVAIADTMRAYVINGYKNRKLPKFLFKIEFIRVNGAYAGFQGYPVALDGSDFADGIFDDLVHTNLLEKKNGQWRVVVDLSRGDVPTPQEAREIKNRMPAGFPADVVPDFWREHLKL